MKRIKIFLVVLVLLGLFASCSSSSKHAKPCPAYGSSPSRNYEKLPY